MTKGIFLEKMDQFLAVTDAVSYMSVGDNPENNTSLFVDSEGWVWLARQQSIKRIKTSINVSNVTQFRYDQYGAPQLRYDQYGEDSGRFFVICNDYSGLDFNKGKIGFFQNGDYSHFEDAIEWFENTKI